MADTLPSRTSTTPARPIGGAPGDLARTVGAMMLQWSNVIALVLLIVVSSMLSPYFLETRNLFNVLRGASIIGIVSIGMTFVILNRGIDLSVGSIVGVATATTALLAPYGFGFAVRRGVGPVVAGRRGQRPDHHAAQASAVHRHAGHADLRSRRGLHLHRPATTSSYATPRRGFPSSDQGTSDRCRYRSCCSSPSGRSGLYVQKNTRFGRYIFAVGANEDASRLYGIHVDRIKLGVYTISGFPERPGRRDPGQPPAGRRTERGPALRIGGNRPRP